MSSPLKIGRRPEVSCHPPANGGRDRGGNEGHADAPARGRYKLGTGGRGCRASHDLRRNLLLQLGHGANLVTTVLAPDAGLIGNVAIKAEMVPAAGGTIEFNSHRVRRYARISLLFRRCTLRIWMLVRGFRLIAIESVFHPKAPFSSWSIERLNPESDWAKG